MWAFSDESERGSLMLLGLLLVPAGAAHDARRELRSLLLPGQRRVHTSDESARRRRQLLDVVAGLDAAAVVFTMRRGADVRRVEARSRLLVAAVAEVTRRACGDLDPGRPAPRSGCSRSSGHRPRPAGPPRGTAVRPPAVRRRAVAVGRGRDRVGRGRRQRLATPHRVDRHRPPHRALNAHTRLLPVRAARRVHFPPLLERTPPLSGPARPNATR